MATIGSLTSSTSSSIYGSTSKGIGGLVSGLDTDTLIDGMTAYTRAKIAKQKQNKTLLEWKTDAYRSVSSKLIDFADKYTSYSSSTNLYSESFFSKNQITTSGENSQYVTVTGSTTNASNITIDAVKQLANNASFTTSEAMSNNYIETGVINYGDDVSCNISGKTLSVKYGSDTYTVTMPEKDGGGVYTSAAEIAAAMQSTLENIDLNNPIDGRTKLSDVMTVSESGGTLVFTQDSGDTSGNSLSISGGDTGLLDTLGISGDYGSIVGEVISGSLSAKAAVNTDELSSTASFQERLSGKTMTFSYNGLSKTITFDDDTKLNETDFVNYLQDKLNTAFGDGRISVSDDGGAIKFQTTTPDGAEDTSSVLKITSASTGLLGEDGVFGISSGTTNKVNLNASLESSGIKGAENLNLVDGTDYSIRINGKDITINYKEGETTVADIISAINNSDADVSISYMENSDKLSVVATQDGAAGDVTFGDTATGELNDLEKLLFGKRDINGDILTDSNELNGTKIEGQDAIVLIDYDGEGGADPLEIVRGTNTFTVDGLSISVSGEFGYDSEGNVIDGEEVTLDAKVDTDKIVDAVKSMINDYNDMVDFVNKTVSEKRDRDYAPLTDEQKEEMSDSEIEAWEEKAKAGMLFGDSNLSSLASELRYVFLNAGSDGLSLKDIGITTSSDWEDNGKISFDEDKFKAALEENPDEVQEMFTAEVTTDATSGLTSGGIMTKMKDITDKYASTTGAVKGIFVEIAGHPDSPASLLQNSLLTQIGDINDTIDNLEDKLESEQERYQSQFTQLEELVQQMNTQSGYLDQMLSS